MIRKAKAMPYLPILGMKIAMMLPFFFLIGQCVDDYLKSPMHQSAQDHSIVICRSPLPVGSKELRLRLKGDPGKLNMTMLEIAKAGGRANKNKVLDDRRKIKLRK